jgi:hypothetical protein
MHNLIMNLKGSVANKKSLLRSSITSNISKNAMQYLPSITPKKILFRYPGKDGKFASAKISVKQEEVKLGSPITTLNISNILSVDTSKEEI